MFEQGARQHPPRVVYRAYLAQSDVFIGLYWQRYGQPPAGADVSGLEEEFDLAAKQRPSTTPARRSSPSTPSGQPGTDMPTIDLVGQEPAAAPEGHLLIQTPDQRLRVFVSSTLTDLELPLLSTIA
jgi:hypothetical protein